MILVSLTALAASAQTNIADNEMQRIYEEVKTPYKYGVVIEPDSAGMMVDCPSVFRHSDHWFMTYVQFDGRGYETWLAESDDLLEWKKLGKLLSFAESGWDKDQRGGYPALQDPTWDGSYALSKHDGQYRMSYIGSATPGYEGRPISIGMAGTDGNPSTAHLWETQDKPILAFDDKDVKPWEERSPYKSIAYQTDFLGHPFVLFYNAAQQVARGDVREKIGIAYSDDMKRWQRYEGNPVFEHDTKGTITGDAQLARMGDLWVMFFYTAHNPLAKHVTYNSFAVSRDLINWTEWKGEPLIYPSESYDARYAHKPFVVKHDGVVYHFYCAVDKQRHRTIALATSKDMKAPEEINNPILSGFHPDPTVCRVGEDYYLCTSSFTWYPGLPIYHSRDLVNWQLVSHAINRPGMVSLEGVADKDGVWAPTLRWHDGKFYLFCNVSNRGNFFITASDVKGEWSAPVFIRDTKGNRMVGIDPDIFWDDDGRSYVVGNHGSFPGRKYRASTAIWIQEIDLATGTLLGERKYISTGHAFNARYAEGPHLYKIDGKYVLLVAEGGTDYYHASTILTSDKLFGPYLAQQVNPVLSQRQLGHGASIQSVGHADMVQTQYGDWYAVCLGKRMIEGKSFTRETFICPVEKQQGEFIFNPGHGMMTAKVERPKLPWTPVGTQTQWYYERIPHTKFDTWDGGQLQLKLLPETLDSLTSPALVMRKVSPLGFSATARLSFQAKKKNEEAGLVLHRNARAYISFTKTKDSLRVTAAGKTVVSVPYKDKDVVLAFDVDGLNATLSYGTDSGHLHECCQMSLLPLAEDNRQNRFNGLGIGMYASSNGKKSNGMATFNDFTYKGE